MSALPKLLTVKAKSWVTRLHTSLFPQIEKFLLFWLHLIITRPSKCLASPWGVYSLILPIRGCSTGRQGMVLTSLLTGYTVSRQSVLNRVYNSCKFVVIINKVLPAVLNRVRVLNPHFLTYTQILVEYSSSNILVLILFPWSIFFGYCCFPFYLKQLRFLRASERFGFYMDKLTLLFLTS